MHFYPTEMCIDSMDRFLANTPWGRMEFYFIKALSRSIEQEER